MKSLSEIIQTKVDETPFLRENLSQGLINTSALARKLKPSLEKSLGKTIKDSTIIMAIGRLPLSKFESIEKRLTNFIDDIGDLIVRSNLVKYNYQNYIGISKNQSSFLEKSEELNDSFYTVSRGITETTIIINHQLQSILEKNLNSIYLLSKTERLSAITMKLPANNTEVEGIYYYILKKLAWNNISVEEVISTTNEFTIVVKSELVSKAFSVLINMKEF
jgi:hypothetical protein